MHTVWGNSPFCIPADARVSLAGSPSPSRLAPCHLSQRERLWRNRTLCTSAGNLQSRKPPLPSAHYVRSHLPQGDGFRGGGKVSGIAQRRPLEGRLPPAGGRCRAATKGGIWLCAAKTEGVFPQRRAFAESGAVNAVFRHDPSREKAIRENPQIFPNCKYKINIPLFMRRAKRSAFQIVPPPLCA